LDGSLVLQQGRVALSIEDTISAMGQVMDPRHRERFSREGLVRELHFMIQSTPPFSAVKQVIAFEG
jgi:hypothetical protein